MVQPDQNHERSRKALVKLDAVELRRRIDIENYRHPNYVESEVLASLVRARFGKDSGVLDHAGAVLYGRLMTLIDRYFSKNTKWHAVVYSSSETLKDATSYAWLVMLEDKNTVSFAEVRFLPWVEARAEDYLQQQLAQKNQIQALETMSARDEDGREMAYENSLEGDADDLPDAILERKQLSARLNTMCMGFEHLVRRAVYFRLECRYEWSKVAELLDCSVPTARKYYNIGMEGLKGAMK